MSLEEQRKELSREEIDYERVLRSESELTSAFVEDHCEGMVKHENIVLKNKYRRGEAIEGLTKIGNAGSVTACFNLGNCYVFGFGTKRDICEGMKWYEKGYVLLESGEGINDLGRSESNCGFMPVERFNIGRVTKKNMGRGVIEAMKLFNLSAESPNRQALHILFTTLLSGGERFVREGDDELRRIKEKHFPHFDILRQACRKHQSQDHSAAMALYQVVLREGNVFERQIANFNLGYCFFSGKGVPGGADRGKAFMHWKEGGVINPDDVELMEMLSNSPFMDLDTINVSGQGLGDEVCVAFAEAFKINTNTRTFHISGSNWNNNPANPLPVNPSLTSVGARAFGEMLKCNSTLTYLNICCNEMGDEGATSIAEGLEHNSTLKEINIGTNLIGNEGAIALADALRVNSTLTSLHLVCNQIWDDGAKELAKVLNERQVKLSVLRIRFNKIGPSGKKALDDAMPGINWTS